ncbi:UDP-glucose 6-dehydrogenase [hydrothermal vent metagenome]|uniref:UDP-glucose 6-dehydrogenase n=1 Tax=hydrothermal vent metagenome TaxID=652676 RepID=A0A3B0TDG5_9ZZZZ
MNIYERIITRQSKLAVIGLGYVGLPLAVAFAKRANVIGFDIDKDKLKLLKKGIDPNGELESSELQGLTIEFTDDEKTLRNADFFIITVPTPIDSHNNPDLSILKGAAKTVAAYIKAGSFVVFESTVYPGVTEDICIPILEKISGLKVGNDFKVGYSPERINPGDKVHTLSNTNKIVSACDEESLQEVSKAYKLVVDAEIHQAPSIKVAEAAKIIENTQRDVNIALMNELSIIFGRIGINTYDVLEAAGTKWNFLNFYPGLVGGHCIGVDPYYLAHKAKELKYHPQIINSGRFVNDSMGRYAGKQIVKQLLKNGIKIPGAKALVLGVTFKENVSDIRNSKVFDIAAELDEFGIDVTLTDPLADHEDVEKTHGRYLSSNPFNNGRKEVYDVIILAVAHEEYLNYSKTDIQKVLNSNGVFIDIKGVYRRTLKGISYWSL